MMINNIVLVGGGIIIKDLNVSGGIVLLPSKKSSGAGLIVKPPAEISGGGAGTRPSETISEPAHNSFAENMETGAVILILAVMFGGIVLALRNKNK